MVSLASLRGVEVGTSKVRVQASSDEIDNNSSLGLSVTFSPFAQIWRLPPSCAFGAGGANPLVLLSHGRKSCGG